MDIYLIYQSTDTKFQWQKFYRVRLQLYAQCQKLSSSNIFILRNVKHSIMFKSVVAFFSAVPPLLSIPLSIMQSL